MILLNICRAIAAMAVLFDALVTYRALKTGITEWNPILLRLFGAQPPLSIVFAWRALILGLMFWLVPTPWWGWLIFAAFFAIVTARNLALMRSRT